LFGIGLGWNFSYVAATAELADRTVPVERGKILGFTDLCSGFLGATLALLGGLLLSAVGSMNNFVQYKAGAPRRDPGLRAKDYSDNLLVIPLRYLVTSAMPEVVTTKMP